MKVFLPMTDQMMEGSRRLGDAKLVPFKPEFMERRTRKAEGYKPSNWITESDYMSARQRAWDSVQFAPA